ncbi:MAG: hypothetical protein Q8L55_02805 [Phycisphaerales bacterium]|nr:hypothetical protein [Phycisphaerales bacterium]
MHVTNLLIFLTGVALAATVPTPAALAEPPDAGSSVQIATVSGDTGSAELGSSVGSQPKPPAFTDVRRAPAVSPEGADSTAKDPSRLHLTLGNEITSAYYFRGFRQEDSGLIAQPYADLSLDVFRAESTTVSLKFGLWNSFHGVATGATTSDGFLENWYEFDVYAGVAISTGKWTFEARYSFYTSPSGAFGTIEEVGLTASFDDTELLGAWSLKPTVALAFESGANAADGGRKGAYLQLGIAPGFSFDAGLAEAVAVSFPASVGLSLSNYYEGMAGENDTFGFASVGAKASVPLKLGSAWGDWAVSAGVQAVFLGDAAQSFNNGERTEVIYTIGASIAF